MVATWGGPYSSGAPVSPASSAASSSIRPSAASSRAAQSRWSSSPRCQSTDRLVDRDVTALERPDDLLELAPQLLEASSRPSGPASLMARTSIDRGREPAGRELDLEPVSGSGRGRLAQGLAAGPDDRVAAGEGRARRERLEAGGGMVEGDSPPFEEEEGSGPKPLSVAVEPLPVAGERPPHGGVHRSSRSRPSPSLQLGEVRNDETGRGGGRRRANVGGEVAQRRVLLVADGRDDRHGAGGERADDGLVAEGQQVLEAAAAARHDDDVDQRVGRDAPERGGDARPCGRTLHAGLGDDDVRRGEAGADAGHDIASRRRVGARDHADGARETAAAGACARRRTAPRRPARA